MTDNADKGPFRDVNNMMYSSYKIILKTHRNITSQWILPQLPWVAQAVQLILHACYEVRYIFQRITEVLRKKQGHQQYIWWQHHLTWSVILLCIRRFLQRWQQWWEQHMQLEWKGGSGWRSICLDQTWVSIWLWRLCIWILEWVVYELDSVFGSLRKRVSVGIGTRRGLGLQTRKMVWFLPLW